MVSEQYRDPPAGQAGGAGLVRFQLQQYPSISTLKRVAAIRPSATRPSRPRCSSPPPTWRSGTGGASRASLPICCSSVVFSEESGGDWRIIRPMEAGLAGGFPRIDGALRVSWLAARFLRQKRSSETSREGSSPGGILTAHTLSFVREAGSRSPGSRGGSHAIGTRSQARQPISTSRGDAQRRQPPRRRGTGSLRHLRPDLPLALRG